MKFFCSQCKQEIEEDKFEEFRTKTNLRMGKINCLVCGLTLFRRLDTDYHLEKDQNKSANDNQ